MMSFYTISVESTKEFYEQLGVSYDLFHALINSSLEFLRLETLFS